MFNRLFAAAILIAILGAPIAGLFSFAGQASTTPSIIQQKTMCLTTGISCGAGHVVLPAFRRM